MPSEWTPLPDTSDFNAPSARPRARWRKRLLLVVGVLFLAWFYHRWTNRSFDVGVRAPDAFADTLDAGMPTLSRELRKHPTASRFRVSYRVVPDENKPIEFLPRALIYDRSAHRLSWTRERGEEAFTNVQDAHVLRLAQEGGGASALMAMGCRRESAPR